MTENELAQIRLAAKNESFYEALKRFIATGGAGLPATDARKNESVFQPV